MKRTLARTTLATISFGMFCLGVASQMRAQDDSTVKSSIQLAGEHGYKVRAGGWS